MTQHRHSTASSYAELFRAIDGGFGIWTGTGTVSGHEWYNQSRSGTGWQVGGLLTQNSGLINRAGGVFSFEGVPANVTFSEAKITNLTHGNVQGRWDTGTPIHLYLGTGQPYPKPISQGNILTGEDPRYFYPVSNLWTHDATGATFNAFPSDPTPQPAYPGWTYVATYFTTEGQFDPFDPVGPFIFGGDGLRVLSRHTAREGFNGRLLFSVQVDDDWASTTEGGPSGGNPDPPAPIPGEISWVRLHPFRDVFGDYDEPYRPVLTLRGTRTGRARRAARRIFRLLRILAPDWRRRR